ncbi:hypothetical protein FNV43_RR00739 [Rhamnella rubrinervis]|uniref:Uncharacterized protein n=1 Tax=Rhamnella rubrinervis TaxID=2594499 RepID=A0A8K0MSP5_9ROSA|nr:hypothetical protein FNV43_RR00739 [Rhamnella rubrinervis]
MQRKRNPVLNMTGQEFRVQSIDQSRRRMIIARLDIWENSDLCFSNGLIKNTTLNYTIFDYPPLTAVRNLTLSYDCPVIQPPPDGFQLNVKNFTCGAGGENNETVYYFAYDYVPVSFRPHIPFTFTTVGVVKLARDQVVAAESTLLTHFFAIAVTNTQIHCTVSTIVIRSHANRFDSKACHDTKWMWHPKQQPTTHHTIVATTKRRSSTFKIVRIGLSRVDLARSYPRKTTKRMDQWGHRRKHVGDLMFRKTETRQAFMTRAIVGGRKNHSSHKYFIRRRGDRR